MMENEPKTNRGGTPQKILPLGVSSHNLTFKTSIGPSLRAFFITLPFISLWSLYTENPEILTLLGIFVPGIWILLSVKKAGYASYLFFSMAFGYYLPDHDSFYIYTHTGMAQINALFLYQSFAIANAHWFLFVYLYNQKIRYNHKSTKENNDISKINKKAKKTIGLLSFFVTSLYVAYWLFWKFPNLVQTELRCGFKFKNPDFIATQCEWHYSYLYSLSLVFTLAIVIISGIAIIYALFRTPIRKYILRGAILMTFLAIGLEVGTKLIQESLFQKGTFVRSFCPETVEEANRQNLIGCHPDSVRR